LLLHQKYNGSHFIWFPGETQSEGGFAPNRVSAASILGVGTTKDKKGLEYYTLDVLTRSADGNEGGKHNLIKATIANGKLWILKVQIGDKRWIRGVDKEALLAFDSFTVSGIHMQPRLVH
jgi:hypothetical protein